ncbi:50S ribosome-binding GTPase [bacterium]|nr:50S ribosome-binding GTPase [bacterium]
MSIKIALAGNPNSGKTTLFNDLTGSHQYVGNWPGVTVEKKEGFYEGDKEFVIQDLPGIYSLSPYSLEERISRQYLVQDSPDGILNIVDGTNIERNLYLTTQLAELGVPMVVAVNMMDLVNKRGDKFDLEKLGKRLGCKVIGISAQKGVGCKECAEAIFQYAKEAKPKEAPHVFSGSVEHAIAHIEESIQGDVPEKAIRWYAIKIFERDKEIIEKLNLAPEILEHVEEHIIDCEKELDDDAESIITAQRYEFIQKLISECVKFNEKARQKESLSDRIDRIVTNRILAIPVFVLALMAMYWLAVSDNGPGTKLTDWANDEFLGDGWFLPFTQHAYVTKEVGAETPWYEGKTFEEASSEYEPHGANVEKWQAAYTEAYDEKNGEGAFEKDLAASGSEEEFEVLDESLASGVKTEVWLEDEETGEIRTGNVSETDGLISAEDDEEAESELKWTCDYPMYKRSSEVEEPDPSSGFGVWIPGVGALCEKFCDAVKLEDGSLARALIMDGIVGGVCTVLGFVPVIAIVFLFLAFLEDCGYMARVAFIMDRLFRSFGLSGKSFIPMLVGKGCGVPAVMAARTIENVRDQRMTVILATFIPCGAKTVIIAMFSAVFFREYWWVAASMDFLGVAIIVLGGIALKKTKLFGGEAAPFVMELPAYHLPTLKGILIHTWNRVRAYVIKAGVVIFPCCVVLTLMMTFSWNFSVVGDAIDQSILASVGRFFSWFTYPLGFGNWQGTAASISAEIAKEQATATLGMIASGDGSAAANILAMFKEFAGQEYKFAALAFMVFNLFIPPCVVAIVATFREMGSKAWGWFAFAFQMFVGYLLALNAFQVGRCIAFGTFGTWTAITIILDVIVFLAIVRPAPKVK